MQRLLYCLRLLEPAGCDVELRLDTTWGDELGDLEGVADGGGEHTRGSNKAAGFDLYSNEATTLAPGQIAPIATGIKITPPTGTYARIAPRSGLSLKGISTTAGVVDRDYTGEVKVMLINQSKSPFVIHVGDRIAQLVLERIAEADIQLVQSLDTTARGAHGFGSTGK